MLYLLFSTGKETGNSYWEKKYGLHGQTTAKVCPAVEDNF